MTRAAGRRIKQLNRLDSCSGSGSRALAHPDHPSGLRANLSCAPSSKERNDKAAGHKCSAEVLANRAQMTSRGLTAGRDLILSSSGAARLLTPDTHNL